MIISGLVHHLKLANEYRTKELLIGDDGKFEKRSNGWPVLLKVATRLINKDKQSKPQSQEVNVLSFA